MKKILIPTDCSDLADYAYDIAKRIAQKTGATICALSVVSVPAGVVFDKAGEVFEDGEPYLATHFDLPNLNGVIKITDS